MFKITYAFPLHVVFVPYTFHISLFDSFLHSFTFLLFICFGVSYLYLYLIIIFKSQTYGVSYKLASSCWKKFFGGSILNQGTFWAFGCILLYVYVLSSIFPFQTLFIFLSYERNTPSIMMINTDK